MRGTGVHLKWFSEEYSTPSIENYNKFFGRDEDIEYYSIGSRIYDTHNPQLQYSHNKLFYNDKFTDTQNDGIVCLDETDEGVKLQDLVHSHYDLIGLNGVLDDRLVKIYSEHFKSLHPDAFI